MREIKMSPTVEEINEGSRRFQAMYCREHLEWVEDLINRLTFCCDCLQYKQETEHAGKCNRLNGLVAFNDCCTLGYVQGESDTE